MVAEFNEKEALKQLVAHRALLETGPKLKKHVRMRIQQDLMAQHQQVLLMEAQAQSLEEKKQWMKHRREIEKLQQKLQQVETFIYQKKTKQMAPKQKTLKNSFWAFLVGGLICVIGQLIFDRFAQSGIVTTQASAATSVVLIFIGALMTGIGIYDELGKVAGAGSIVPITGFANSVASSALEFKREGYIYGVGARMFTVAGPVIVYGVAVSMFIGLTYYFIK